MLRSSATLLGSYASAQQHSAPNPILGTHRSPQESGAAAVAQIISMVPVATLVASDSGPGLQEQTARQPSATGPRQRRGAVPTRQHEHGERADGGAASRPSSWWRFEGGRFDACGRSSRPAVAVSPGGYSGRVGHTRTWRALKRAEQNVIPSREYPPPSRLGLPDFTISPTWAIADK
jgi:hypothetical protein